MEVRPMQILIQAKKSVANAELKAYAQAKLEKLGRHFDHVLEARMELETEKNKSLESLKVAVLTVHVTGRTGNILKAECEPVSRPLGGRFKHLLR